jgi:hypothetical protein
MRRPERPKPSKLAVSNHPSGKRQRLRCEPWLGSCKREHDDQRHRSEARHLAIIFAPAPDVKLTARGEEGTRLENARSPRMGAVRHAKAAFLPTRPDANRRLPWEQFDEIAGDGISRPGRCAAVLRAPSGEPAARRSRYARVTGVVRLPRSRSLWNPSVDRTFRAGTTVPTKGSPSGTAGWRSKPLTAASSFEGSNPSPSVRTGVSPARGQQPIGDVANVERWTRRSAGAR